MSVTAVFEKLRAALEAAQVPYLVTGSFVSSAHGIPRSTNDIDVLIAPTVEQLIALVDYFPRADYYAEREDALEALRHRSQFNVIDNSTLWKVDFIISKNAPFDKSRFARRVRTEIAGVEVYAATAEDIIIAKLLWVKQSESDRQLSDVAGVIKMQGDDLDVGYVEKWVAELNLEREWNAAKERAA